MESTNRVVTGMAARTALRNAERVGRLGCPLLLLLVVAGFLTPRADAAGPPSVRAEWVTGVTSNSAVLKAEIDPEGVGTRYHFEYLTLAASESNLSEGREPFAGARAVPSPDVGLGSGNSAITVSFPLTAPLNVLSADTAYRYRVVATSEAGVAPGAARTLRTKSAAPPLGLLDGRAWEMVSPVDKGGGSVAAPTALFGGGEIQAAAQGGALTYGSATAFADPVAAPPISQYVSVRGPGGWSTADVSVPLEAGGYGDHPDGAPFRLFSTDLRRGLLLNGERCALEGACPPSYSLWAAGSVQTVAAAPGLRFEGATADLLHLVFGAEDGLYEWSGGELEQISADSSAVFAAPIGAISEDGSRVYFTLLEDGPTYLYEAGAGARPLPETVGSPVAFQAASADGSLAYFSRGSELYRYSAAAETSIPIASGVVGVLAVSPDGSRVFYQDGSGLELWNEGAVQQIAAGGEATLPSDYPPATASARLGAGGGVLAFLSAAAIGGYDNTDAETGLPDTEVYLYETESESLLCASCNPSGERPNGSASIPGTLVNGTTTAYRPRALSADGRRLFFESTDALVDGDTNSSTDVYEWEAAGEGGCGEAPGCVSLISGGRGEGGRFLDASADGSDAFFLTGDSLVGSDPGSIDAYDARIGGGLPEPEAPISCNGDACQSLPSPPADPTAGTSVQGAGNPPPHYAKERHRHHRRHKHRHHRHRSHRHEGGR
jgi:hypothetical protein